jgi:sigma-B regulation protein RsbU (phosphoserine phosphatase)
MNTPAPVFPNSTSTLTRVLVAEDDEKTRTALVFLLQRHLFDVTVANDGQAAFECLIAPDPPQIALLDWEMPRLDGLHVSRAVRTLPASRYTYIIMVTARDRSVDVLTAFAAGVDDFLSKPVDAAQLLARLRCGERILGSEERCAQRIVDLEKALNEVRILKRLLPICMYCKKVRDDSDYWQDIDTYIHAQTGTDFSHGICPSCIETVLKNESPNDPVARAERRVR